MAEFLSPDVFVTEVQGKTGQIPAASTSTFAMAGFSLRGQEDKPLLCSSFAEFAQKFGSFTSKSLNAYCAAAFFLNGGSRMYFVRKLAADALYAEGDIDTEWHVRASGRGVWANAAEVIISGNESFYDNATATYSRFNVKTRVKNATTGLLEDSETFEAVVLNDVDDPDFILKVLETSEDVAFTSLLGGTPSSMVPTVHNGNAMGTGDGVETLFFVSLPSFAEIGENTVKVKVNGVVVATDDDGVFLPVVGGPSVSGTVDYLGGDIAIVISTPPGIGAAVTVDLIERGARSVVTVLTGGNDGSAVVSADILGADKLANQTGLYALNFINEMLSIGIPDFAGQPDSEKSLIAYCETRRDAVALIQPPKGYTPQNAVKYRRISIASTSSFAAMYYPWVNIPDPLNKNRPKLIPPCGHVAGRYAFTDRTENVGKAPAGTNRGQLQWLTGIERVLSKGDQDVLYPAQVNYIRSDADVGTAIFGNKTLQPVGDFTDVNVRRLFINLAKEQYSGLLDITFENVGPALWTLIKSRLDDYLNNKFIDGVIGSGVAEADKAFKVVVDESNNPPSIQQAKRVEIDEFVKPNIAAEFIHLKLQKVFDASQV